VLKWTVNILALYVCVFSSAQFTELHDWDTVKIAVPACPTWPLFPPPAEFSVTKSRALAAGCELKLLVRVPPGLGEFVLRHPGKPDSQRELRSAPFHSAEVQMMP